MCGDAGAPSPLNRSDPSVTRRAQLIWNRASELATPRDLDRRLATITAEAGLDNERALRWTVVRLVEYWLWAAGTGQPQGPETCRRLLDWLGWKSVLQGLGRA